MFMMMTVSQFIQYVNDTFRAIWEPTVAIEGEVSEYRLSQGQWVNFSLKDEGGLVSCFSVAQKLRVPLLDGMRVKVYGTPKLYPKYGKFSFSVERVELVGEGDLRRALADLRAKLEREGLFNEERKRSLPLYPVRIALVASRESAAYGDFVRILSERWQGLEIDLYHVLVQGAGSVESVVQALQRIAGTTSVYDAVVITRGGGSLEELMTFNDERVVRAIFACPFPTLVGIGHERDVTLAEEVADVRGSTPTDCARRLVPDREDVLYELSVLDQRIRGGLLEQYERILRLIERFRLGSERWQQLCKATFTHQVSELLHAAERWHEGIVQKVAFIERILHASHPDTILSKGYALIQNPKGAVVSKISQVHETEEIGVRLRDGQFRAIVTSVK